jgi:hypothetical protein
MSDDDPKPDPMTAVLERRREMLRAVIEPPGLARRPMRRGDFERRRHLRP